MTAQENTPLLGEESQRQRPPISGSLLQAKGAKSICLLIAAFSFLIGIAAAVADVPTTRLLEDHICRSYYDGQGGNSTEIDESMCKVEQVQSSMAFLNGWVAMIQCIIELLVAFPYGIYADRNGRKKVHRFALAGVTLTSLYNWAILAMGQSVSINLLLIAPFISLLGGGGTVLVSTMYAIVSDVAEESERVNAFLMLLLGSTAGDLIGLLVASYLMVANPWIPIGISLIFLALSVGIMVFVPETLPPVKRSPDPDMYDDSSAYSAINSNIKEFKDQLLTAAQMLRQPSLCLVLFAFLCLGPAGISTSSMLIQYISKRFGWSMASAGYLLSIRSVGNIFVILIVLPGLSKLLMSGVLIRSLSAQDKDKILAQLSAFALTAGFVLLAAPNIGIVIGGLFLKTFGAGLSSLCRSLAAAHIAKDNAAKLQTVISIITTVGVLVAAPTLAFLFSLGMKLGGLMMGLPYVVMAFYLGITAFALCFVRTATPDIEIIPEAYNLEETVLCDNASIRSFQSQGTEGTLSSSILLRRSRASSHSG